MKGLDVESRSHRLARVLARPLYLEHAKHVRGGLSGKNDVAIDFGVDVLGGLARVLQHVVDRLLARPSHGVDA